MKSSQRISASAHQVVVRAGGERFFHVLEVGQRAQKNGIDVGHQMMFSDVAEEMQAGVPIGEGAL